MRILEPRITGPDAWCGAHSAALPLSLSLSPSPPLMYVVVAWLASTLVPLPLDSSRLSSPSTIVIIFHSPQPSTDPRPSVPLPLHTAHVLSKKQSDRGQHARSRLDEIDPPSRIDRSVRDDGFRRASQGDRNRAGAGGGGRETVLRRVPHHRDAHVARRADGAQVALQRVRDPVQEEAEARTWS